MGADRRSKERICIVGASAAGLFAAWRLRAELWRII
jgi:protoporphyrinogen oxidase